MYVGIIIFAQDATINLRYALLVVVHLLQSVNYYFSY